MGMYADDVSLFAQHNDNALVLLQQALTVLRNEGKQNVFRCELLLLLLLLLLLYSLTVLKPIIECQFQKKHLINRTTL